MTLFNKGRQTESLHFHLQHASFKISKFLAMFPFYTPWKHLRGGGGGGGRVRGYKGE